MSSILIVDDHPLNVHMLRVVCADLGHTLYVASNGLQALEMASYVKPDLVLLDVMMPVIDGFEVCRRLKASPDTSSASVIFVTALADNMAKIRGFELGGEDYITKPYSTDEVRARIKLHMSLREKQRQIEYMREQERTYVARMNELRNEILDQLRHDVKTPLTNIKNSIYLLTKHAQSNGSKVQEYAHRANQSVDEVVDMVSGLLDMARLEMTHTPTFRSVNAITFVHEIVARFQSIAEFREIDLRVDTSAIDTSFNAYFDPEQMASVLENIISNAIKYTESGGSVVLTVNFTGNVLNLMISDTGYGIAHEHINLVFQRFYRVADNADKVEGTGLGLYIARTIVEKHGGKIEVKSELNKGSTFTVTIPQHSFSAVV